MKQVDKEMQIAKELMKHDSQVAHKRQKVAEAFGKTIRDLSLAPVTYLDDGSQPTSETFFSKPHRCF